jgi:hypothetical protein
MKKIVYVILSLALFALFGCSGDDSTSTSNSSSVTNPNPNPFTPKGTVSGLLRDAVTDQPLANVKVSILDREATTNASGLFTITSVPALSGTGSEVATNPGYPVVIDLSALNSAITAYNADTTNTVKKAFYPSTAYSTVSVTYTSLGETSQVAGNTNATNHDTPVDGFVANITPFVGKLDANIKMQVVDTDLKPVTGASVYLYQVAASVSALDNTGTGATQTSAPVAPGHLVQGPLTTDATGFVTFANVEAKQAFAVKATATDGKQGWYANTVVAVNAQAAAVAVTAPADGQTDVYAVQGGTSFASAGNTAKNTALVITTNDGVAPFILSVSPTNLADIAVPTAGTLDVVYTFSEPIRSTNYANAVSADLAASNGKRGIYNDVTVTYDGPKIGNIPHTMEWNANRTTLTVKIPFGSLVAASRYTVSIANAIDANAAGDLLTDNARNAFVVTAFNATTFTTAGSFNVAAPVIAKTNANNSVAVEWATITNAGSYKVYWHKVGYAAFLPTGTAAVANASNGVAAVAGYPTWSLLTVIPDFTNGGTYEVKVTAVNGNSSESDYSNVITFSETAPAAPTGVARRTAATNVSETHIDWTSLAGASGYNVYVERVWNGIGTGFTKANGAAVLTLPTYDTSAALTVGSGGSVYADNQYKVTYNVKVTAVGALGSEGVASSIIVLDDQTRPTAFKSGGLPGAPIAAGTAGVRLTGSATVTFNKPMLYIDIVDATKWDWVFAGATATAVTKTFGTAASALFTPAAATPITLNATSNVATVPWAISTDAAGSVAAGAISLSYTGRSVGGGLTVNGAF